MSKIVGINHKVAISNSERLNDAGLPLTVWELAQLPDELTQPLGISIITDSPISGEIDNLIGNIEVKILPNNDNNDNFVFKSNSKVSWDVGIGVSNHLGQQNVFVSNNEAINITIASTSVDPDFDIRTSGIVTGGTSKGARNGVDPNQREVHFNLIERGTSTGQTWVLLHGWNGDINQINALADTVKAARPGDTVLTLDWTPAAETTGNEIVGLASRNNYNAATWIKPVADFAADALKRWGVSGQNLNFIGHSLGTFLSSEIAWQFGRVNTITALDPASAINTLGGYDFDLTPFPL